MRLTHADGPWRVYQHDAARPVWRNTRPAPAAPLSPLAALGLGDVPTAPEPVPTVPASILQALDDGAATVLLDPYTTAARPDCFGARVYVQGASVYVPTEFLDSEMHARSVGALISHAVLAARHRIPTS